MENKELYKVDINQIITEIVVIDDYATDLFFGTEKINLSTDHEQNCCEHVYGDFSIIKDYAKYLIGKNVKNLVIKSVDEMGFLLCFLLGRIDSEYGQSSVKIFIPCYDYQNGYYSSNLSLLIDNKGTKTEIDITKLVESHER